MNKKQRLFEVMQKVDNSFKPILNENSDDTRNSLINYLANIWSKDKYLLNKINSIPELKNKYYKYLNLDINGWNMLSDDELRQIYNNWAIDSEKYDSTSPNNIEEMGRPAASAINPKYTHFAVLKDSNKIVNGWDYNGHEQSELKQFKKDYFINDIIDMDINPKLVNIYTKNKLMQIGINPFDSNNWYKFEAEGWRDRNDLN